VAQSLIHQIDAYFDTRERATRERLQAMEEEQRNRRREVATEQDAFALALESFAIHLQVFESKNPGSVLTARGTS
jgi:hypothetical protein